MKIEKISKKQKEILKFITNEKQDTIICDGAVRSGKTVFMSFAFIVWAMSKFDGCNFGICGKTVASATRNILKPLQSLDDLSAISTLKFSQSKNLLTVTSCGKTNYFYFFGGKDEASYTLIQGITLWGVMFDEVALMPKSFVDQGIARTLSVANAKLWFNCNPDSPKHWFYKKYLENEDKKHNLHLHFLMTDNPTLSDEQIERAKREFQGAFYDKYVLGLWRVAEGLVFPYFQKHYKDFIISKKDLKSLKSIEIGFDIGGNKSAYALTATAIGYDKKIYVIKSTKKQACEMGMDEVISFVNDFVCDVKNILSECKQEIDVRYINVDHVDVIINTINDSLDLRADKTYKPPLADRVHLYSLLFASGQIAFLEDECNDLIDELSTLVFDEKKQAAIPLDDGTVQIDTYDSFTYSIASDWDYLNEER